MNTHTTNTPEVPFQAAHKAHRETQHKTHQNTLYPVFLKLDALRTLVVGGGNVGLEKITSLANNSPESPITLIAPSIKDEIKLLAATRTAIALHERPFCEDDLAAHDVVIIATENATLNRSIYEQSKSRGLLTNVADTPELCDFYLGSIVQKGDLKIAISTNGKSPTIAKRVKEVLTEAIPDEIHDSLQYVSAIRSRLNGTFADKVRRLNELTVVLVEPAQPTNNQPNSVAALLIERDYVRLAWNPTTITLAILSALLLMVLGHFLFQLVLTQAVSEYAGGLAMQVDVHVLYYIGIGFLAQTIDGAFGMAYGPTTTSFLMAMGISPAIASATLHTSEVFAAGTASLTYQRHRNINIKLFKLLVLTGVAGAVLGSALLSVVSKEQLSIVNPLVALYTLVLGGIIIRRALSLGQRRKKQNPRLIPIVGFVGSFFDSTGGGGWGAIVTSSLVAFGRDLRYTIGSAHLAKFFVATASTITFVVMIGFHHWLIVAGVVVGSMIAAPMSVMLGNRIPKRTGLTIVGVLVILLSLRTLLRAFGVPL